MNNKAVIILVRPQMGENIGSSARIMANFGLSDLRIVSPRDGWPNERAISLAAKADYIVSDAKLHDNLSDAISDCHYAYAVTARLRDIDIEVYHPRQAAIMASETDGKVAFVFGAENNGLTNDEVMQCNAILNIPTAEYASLNLSHSVGIIAYEYFLQERQTELPQRKNVNANIGSINALLKRLSPKINADDALQQQLLQMLLRSNLSEAEVSLLHGLIK